MLQFADDTTFLCKFNYQNIVTNKSILIYFQITSGLKVNYRKSKTGGISVDN